MGLLDFLSKPFVDVLDWVEQPGELAIRFPMQDREIRNGAQLTVREGQAAFFHNEGQMADAFEAGMYRLETSSLPLLTALMHWDHGFASPFKSDVYFYTTKEQVGLKWGTAQPITVRDRDYGPLRVRAFGGYSFRVDNLALFAVKVMGTLDRLTVADIEPQLRGAIAAELAGALGGSEIAFVDLAADQVALSQRLKEAVQPAFAQWGLLCTSFFVESLSLPAEVQAHMDKASAMRVVGNVDDYVRFQAASAPAAQAEAPPPIEDPFAQIEKLHRLLVAGAITQEEFDAKKAVLLARIA
jgi:membrane protease subunit (stomatin/prohibitin family)